MALRIACVIDPLETLKKDHDTSLAILWEAQKRGHEVHVCGIGELSARQGLLHLRTQGLDGRPDSEIRPADRFDLIFMRKDPPVDAAYLEATYLLDLSPVPVWNSPSGLREASEKCFAFRFDGISPRSAISRDRFELRAFLEEVGGKTVLKPLDGYAGKGIFLARAGDPNLNVIFETLTAAGRRAVLAQEYLPQVSEGDKRILLLDGEPLGALNRLPSGGEFRANMAAGGTYERAVVTDRDRELIAKVKPGLVRWGLRFVGLDVIGGFVTEINVTSPTCLVEIAALDKKNLAAEVVARWEQLYG